MLSAGCLHKHPSFTPKAIWRKMLSIDDVISPKLTNYLPFNNSIKAKLRNWSILKNSFFDQMKLNISESFLKIALARGQTRDILVFVYFLSQMQSLRPLGLGYCAPSSMGCSFSIKTFTELVAGKRLPSSSVKYIVAGLKRLMALTDEAN